MYETQINNFIVWYKYEPKGKGQNQAIIRHAKNYLNKGKQLKMQYANAFYLSNDIQVPLSQIIKQS